MARRRRRSPDHGRGAIQGARAVNAEPAGRLRALVTGGAGRLGRSVIAALAGRGHRPYGMRKPDHPKLVLPISGHATVNKAASYLGVEVVRTALRPDLRADVDALEALG